MRVEWNYTRGSRAVESRHVLSSGCVKWEWDALVLGLKRWTVLVDERGSMPKQSALGRESEPVKEVNEGDPSIRKRQTADVAEEDKREREVQPSNCGREVDGR